MKMILFYILVYQSLSRTLSKYEINFNLSESFNLGY